MQESGMLGRSIKLVRNRFTPVIVLGLYGVVASMLLLSEYFQKIQLLEDVSQNPCAECACNLQLLLENYLKHSSIGMVPIPLLSTTLFIIIVALGLIGLVAGGDQMVSKMSIVAVLILSAIGVAGGAYLLYIMLYVLKTICTLCISLDAALWTLTAYATLRIFKHNQ